MPLAPLQMSLGPQTLDPLAIQLKHVRACHNLYKTYMDLQSGNLYIPISAVRKLGTA